jgi:5-methylcytosine-specific restriction endonuclease McrA
VYYYKHRVSIRQAVRRRAHDHCEICGIKLTHLVQTEADFGSLHHRFPRRDGGMDEITCLIQLCRSCHIGLVEVGRVLDFAP